MSKFRLNEGQKIVLILSALLGLTFYALIEKGAQAHNALTVQAQQQK